MTPDQEYFDGIKIALTGKEALFKTLIAVSEEDNFIQVYRPFFRFTGSIEGAMMLRQLLFWTPRCGRQDGYIAKTPKDFGDEIMMGEYAILRVRKDLEALGILETKTMKWNGTPMLHWKIVEDVLLTKWCEFIAYNEEALSNSQLLGKPIVDSCENQDSNNNNK